MIETIREAAIAVSEAFVHAATWAQATPERKTVALALAGTVLIVLGFIHWRRGQRSASDQAFERVARSIGLSGRERRDLVRIAGAHGLGSPLVLVISEGVLKRGLDGAKEAGTIPPARRERLARRLSVEVHADTSTPAVAEAA